MGNSKKLSLAIAGLILGASLVACDDGRGGAESAAKQFAAAVSALDVGPVAFDGKDSAVAKQQVQDVFKALDPDRPSVETGDLSLDGKTATVPLNYTWKIGSDEWKYTTYAEFTKSGDKWLTVWNPASAGGLPTALVLVSLTAPVAALLFLIAGTRLNDDVRRFGDSDAGGAPISASTV